MLAFSGASGNIDRLTNEGLRFTHTFAVHGMRSPTRATLLTGLQPSQHGIQDWLDDEEMPLIIDRHNALPDCLKP